MSVAGFVLSILLLIQTADAWYGTGVRLGSAGKPAEAIEAYRKAVSQDPRHVEAWNNLADLLRRAGDRAAAEDAIEHALAIDPNHPRAALNAALLQLESKNASGALGFIETARKGMGDLPALDYLTAKAYLELNDYPSAQPYLTRFRQSASSSPSGSLELATLLTEREEYAAAAELLLSVTEDKRTPEIQLRLGQAWYSLDRMEAARDAFVGFVKSAPDDSRGSLWLGHAERGLGDGEAAEREWQKALKLNPASVDALVALADLELDRGRATESLAFADRAQKLSPDVPAVLLVRGLALLRLQRAAEAAAALSGIPASVPEYSRALYPLSRACRQLGNIEKADALLREFQSLEKPGRKRPR